MPRIHSWHWANPSLEEAKRAVRFEFLKLLEIPLSVPCACVLHKHCMHVHVHACITSIDHSVGYSFPLIHPALGAVAYTCCYV